MLLRGIAAQNGQDSDALFVLCQEEQDAQNVAIAGGVVAGYSAAYGAYSIAPLQAKMIACFWSAGTRLLIVMLHRGLYNNEAGIPENSLLAFPRSCREGLWPEVDVHLTADNKLVVAHDSVSLILPPAAKIAEEPTLEELRGLRLLCY